MSSSEVAFVARLPPEIMDKVTQCLSYHDLGRLLLLGDKAFSSLLRRKGSVTILDYSKRVADITWYPLLNAFEHLTSLVFGHEMARVSGLEGLILPNKLTRLELSGQLTSLGVNTLNLGLLVPHLNSLFLDILLDTSFSDWILTLPRTLTSFSVPRFISPCPLPQGLTAFGVSYVFEGYEKAVFPSTLQSLRLSFRNSKNLNRHIFDLPPQLHDLYLRSNQPTDWESLLRWPDTLQSLELSNVRILKHPFPQSLTQLTYSRYIESIRVIQAFPAHLTDITLYNLAFGRISASELFAALPRCLLRLWIGYDSLIEGDASDFDKWVLGPDVTIPPTLQSLRTQYNSLFKEAIHAIPPSITTLALGDVHQSIDRFPAWPLLRTVTMGICLTPSHLCHLAQGSPYLSRISVHDLNGMGAGQNPWETHDDISINASLGFRFGPSLTQFEATGCSYISDSLISMLPRSLKTLQIPSATQITDLGIQALQPFTSLESLDITEAPITGNSFKFIPTSLTVLLTSKATEIFDHQIQDLPRSLTTLQLQGAVHLTDACAISLPPKLTTFNAICNEKMTSQIIPLLPPNFLLSGATFATQKRAFRYRE